MRKRAVLLSAILLLSVATAPVLLAGDKATPENVDSFASNQVDIYFEGACQDGPCGHGYIVGGVTYVPVRLVMETTGLAVKWDSASRSVHVSQAQSKQEPTDDPLAEFLSAMDFEVRQLPILDQQLDAAKELVEELDDKSFLLDFYLNKIPDKRNRFNELIKAHGELETDSVTKTRLLDLISSYGKIIDHFDSAAQAYERYLNMNRNVDFLSYCSNRKQALELIDSLLRDIRDLAGHQSAAAKK